MELTELFNEFLTGTTIQKNEHLKKFHSFEILISASIRNIENNKIVLYQPWRGESKYEGYLIELFFDKETFGKQMLIFSQGDDVIIKAKPKSASFSYDYSHFKFDLVSIEKLGTTIQSRAEAENKAKQLLAEKKDKGCFIATACYGDFNAPEVVLLRNYRDTHLLQSFFGKILVHFYYIFSPFFASLIIKSDLLKKSIRHYILKPIITKLQEQNYYNGKLKSKLHQKGRSTAGNKV
jgi:hypothetical protein